LGGGHGAGDGWSRVSSWWPQTFQPLSTSNGTPLVEPFGASYDLVTFLWRAEPAIFSEPIDHHGISVSFLDKYVDHLLQRKGKVVRGADGGLTTRGEPTSARS
jgi:hypothetical protein